MSGTENEKYSSDDEDDFVYEVEESKAKNKSNPAQIGLIDCNIKEDDVLEVEDIVLGGNFINKNIPKELLECKLCKKSDKIRLLMKSFLPVEKDSEYCLNSDDRWLYLIQCNSCINRDGSIRCIREIRYNSGNIDLPAEEISEKEETWKLNPFAKNNDATTNPFGSSSNPFAMENSNPFAAASSIINESSDSKKDTSETKTIDNENKKKHDSKPDLKVDLSESYTPYFVYLDKETFHSKPQSNSKKTNFDNIQIDDPSIDLKDLENTKNVKEVEVDPLISKLTTSLTDPQFNKFTSVLEYNPDQVLRLSSSPIFFKSDAFVKAYYNKNTSKEHIPKMNGSDKNRVFEFQLMPYAISKLENGIEVDLENVGMEWGTILVFTDPQSFTPNGRGVSKESSFVEEFVHVQWDD